MKQKRDLSNVSFSFPQAHLAATSEDEPACSGAVDPILTKALGAEDLTDKQKDLLDQMGYVYPDLTTKSTSEDSNPGSQHSVDNKTKLTETDDDMSDEINKALKEEMAELKLELAIGKSSKSIAGFSFDAELEVELSKSLANCSKEDRAVIVKGLTAVKEAGEAALTAAVDVEKAVKTEDENPLAKALTEEAGDNVVFEEEGEQSALQKALNIVGLQEGESK